MSGDCSDFPDNVATLLLPQRTLQKNSVYYDVCCGDSWVDYLKPMINMAKLLETNECKVLRVFPMRSSTTPSYVPIDSKTLMHTLVSKEDFYALRDHLNLPHASRDDIVRDHVDELWDFFFKTDRQSFRRGRGAKSSPTSLVFSNRISTDGIGASIIAKHRDAQTGFGKCKSKKKETRSEEYVDELSDVDKLVAYGKFVVGVDPGKNDLIHCSASLKDIPERGSEIIGFRYTNKQRIFEMGTMKQRRERRRIEKENNVDDVRDRLSVHTSKTLNDEKLAEYIKEKNAVNAKLRYVYTKEVFRTHKLHAIINKRRSEDNMLNAFEKKFGNSFKAVICIGNWSKTRVRNQPPTMGIGMRSLLRRRGYDVYLAKEHFTSKRCFRCRDGSCVETFHTREGESEKVWGLTRCQACSMTYDRDRNASCNIRHLALCALRSKQRPGYLTATPNGVAV